MHECMHTLSHVSHRENRNAGVYLCWEPYKDVVYEVQVQCGSCLTLIKLSCATFWREPLPPPFFVSPSSHLSLCVEPVQCCSPSVAHSCHHVPESDFKGLNDQKISTKEKNIAVQLQGEVLCTGHTGSEVFWEPSWGKKTTGNKTFHLKLFFEGQITQHYCDWL